MAGARTQRNSLIQSKMRWVYPEPRERDIIFANDGEIVLTRRPNSAIIHVASWHSYT